MQQMISMSTYQRYSPVVYPWGTSLILSIPLKCFGLDYQAFKITETVFFIGFLGLFYMLFRCREKNFLLPLSLVILLGFNPFYLYFCNYISSELFFLFFVAASLWGIHSCYKDDGICHSYIFLLFLGVLLFFTAQIRTEGYLLFVSLSVAQYRNGQQYRMFFLPYISALACFVCWGYIFPSGYLSHFYHLEYVTWTGIWQNTESFFLYPGRLMAIPYPLFCSAFWFLVIVGTYCSFRKYKVEITYFLLACLILIIWPYNEIRYWTHVFPLALFLFFKGTGWVIENYGASRRKLVFPMVLLVLYTNMLYDVICIIGTNAPVYTTSNPNIESEDACEVFQFLKQHSHPNDVVACGESRAIYLYTGRLSCNQSGELNDMLDTVDWYVEFLARHKYLQYSHSTFRENKKYFRKVLQNNTFAIYQVIKP